jgi:hypothetical protein
MDIDLNVLQHLGMKMYTSLPAVVSEYVANAWDAWATEVDISIPKNERMSEDYEVIIEDNGDGMSLEEVDSNFLVVGRPKRQFEDETKERGDETRPMMGRKGIGKLAGFGVAGIVQVETRKNGEYVKFELNYDEMMDEAKPNFAKSNNATKQAKLPTTTTEYIIDDFETGDTDKPDGTKITLTNLKREQRPATRYVRQRISRRFSVIGENFDVKINGESVDVDERNLKERTQFLVEYDNHQLEIDDDARRTIENKEGIEPGDLTVSGWIGTFENPVPDDIGSGVVVITRGKLAQEPSTFGVREGGTHGQRALQYLVGEIRADFLDQGDVDLIATDRGTFNHEETPGSQLYDFVNKEVTAFCADWPDKRGRAEIEDLQKKKPYQRFIEPLDDLEKDLADDFLGKLAKQEGYDDEMLEEMASYVSSGVQQKAFSRILEDLNNSDVTSMGQLVELFDKYEVLDAINTLRIIKGRYQAIQKFDQLVDSPQSIKPEFYQFIEDNPWLVDPQWDYLDDEPEVREALDQNFAGEGGVANRVGFVALGDSESVKAIDIRRPGSEIEEAELNQLKRYIDFLRGLKGSRPINDRKVEGYLIGQRLSNTQSVQQEYQRRMKPDDMYVRSYQDLREKAHRSHEEFIDVIRRKAERTNSDMLESELQSVTDEQGNLVQD